jgi:hypothetical protein
MDAWRLLEDLEAVARADRDPAAELRERIRHFREDHGLPMTDEIIEWIALEAGTIDDGWHSDEPNGGGALIGWRTAAEHAAMARVHGRAHALVAACAPYVDAHAPELGTRWIDIERGEYHLTFVGDARAHEAALHELVDDAAGLFVEQAQRSEAELLRLQSRVSDGIDELAALGITVTGSLTDGRSGVVVVWHVAPDAEAAARELRERYGEAVLAAHDGTETSFVKAHAWQLYTTNSAGTEVTVHMLGNAAIPFERIECEEGGDEVRLTVFVRQWRGAVTLQLSTESATVALDRPLAGRLVVDGTSGRVRGRRTRSE